MIILNHVAIYSLNDLLDIACSANVFEQALIASLTANPDEFNLLIANPSISKRPTSATWAIANKVMSHLLNNLLLMYPCFVWSGKYHDAMQVICKWRSFSSVMDNKYKLQAFTND